MPATPQPINPISLGGTLYGMDVNGPLQAAYAQQQAVLQQHALEASQAAQQAEQQYGQAAGQGIPQDPALAQLLSTLIPGIADAITGGTGAQQRQEQRRVETRQEALQNRHDNLVELRDRYREAADRANKINDLKTEIQMRSKTDILNRQLDEMRDQIKFQQEKELTQLRGKNVVRGTTKGPAAPKKATPAQTSQALRWLEQGNIAGFSGHIKSFPDLADNDAVVKAVAKIKRTNPAKYKQIQDALGE